MNRKDYAEKVPENIRKEEKDKLEKCKIEKVKILESINNLNVLKK